MTVLPLLQYSADPCILDLLFLIYTTSVRISFRFSADEIYTVRQIVNPILQAEWDLRCEHNG